MRSPARRSRLVVPRSVVPPIMAVFSVLAEPDPVALDVVLLELAELPQAAIISAAASPAGTGHLLFVCCLRSLSRSGT